VLRRWQWALIVAAQQLGGNMLILTNDDIAPLLTMSDCIGAIEAAFRDFGHGDAVDLPRQDALVPNRRQGAVHDLKTMSGSWPGAGIAALRLNSDVVHWPVVRGAPRREKIPLSEPGGRYNGAVLLFSTETGQLLCMMNDGIMQKSRVAAASGVAARYLARADARILGLLGAGLQAGGQLEAMCAVRRFEQVKIFSPTAEKCRRFAEEFRQLLQIDIRAVDSAAEAASGVDVLVTATNSMTATIRPEWIRPGLHLSSIRRSEIPPAAFARVDRLIVNARETGRNYVARNCPDVPELASGADGNNSGLADLAAVPELKDLVTGKVIGRQAAGEITCFHNFQGLGLQFAALGSLVYREAVRRKIGLQIEDSYFTQTVHP
jgi:ornithine cyclodeaminase/alanine dehydrogenase-like protein (mu-crystallin family)